MRQWIRWWGLGVFIAIVLLLWLGTNPLIKWTLESAGTQAVGARVQLDSVNLGLNPVTLDVNRLQVTNPDAPLRNLMEVRHIQISLDGYALLRRQFIAENMAVEGLRFDTARQSSGAIDGRWFSGKKDKSEDEGTDLGALLPGIQMPDPDKIIAEQRATLTGKVDDIDSQAQQIVQRWNQRIDTLPNQDSVDQYKKRWQALSKQNPLSRAVGVKDLKKDIDKDLATVRSLDEQLKQDRKKLADLSEQARTLPSREADRLMAASGLDQGFKGVTRKLLGEQLNSWVDMGLTGYRLASEQMAGSKQEKPSKPPRGEGQYIRFPEKEPLPQFLIKRAAVDGIADMAGSAVNFSGSLRNITHEPKIWGKPMTLDIDGSGAGGTALTMQGNFDHTGDTGKDTLTFSVKKLTLKDATFSASKTLPIVLQQGLADINGTLSVTDGQLDASVNTRVNQARFSAGGEDTGATTQRLARAIEGVSGFDLNLSLTGPLASPKIGMNSNLDKIIGQALGEEVRGEVAKARAKLEARLRDELGAKLDAVAARQGALDQYKQQIEQRRNALQGIVP